MENRDIYLLERYFDRTLTAAERTELESRVATNAALAREFDWQKQVAAGFARADAEALKAQLQAEENRAAESPLRVSWYNPGVRLYAIAAALVFALGAIWFFNRGPRLTPQELVAQNFSAFENRYADRARGGETRPAPGMVQADSTFDIRMAEALAPYSRTEFHASEELLRRIRPETREQKMALRFYVGNCILGQRRYADSFKMFEPLTREPNFWQAEAQWYLALAQLGAGQTAEAKASLQAYLALPNGRPHRAQVEALLKQL